MNKDLKKLLEALDEQGFEVKSTKKSHLRILKGGKPVTTLAGTPSDRRSWLNGLSHLKRHGFIWPPPKK